jgi:hypothetical protein
MEAQFFASLVVESTAPNPDEMHVSRNPSPPAKAVPRTYPAVPQRQESVELDRLHLYSAGDTGSMLLPEAETEILPAGNLRGELEHGVEALQSVWNPYMNRFRLLSACLMNFANGMNDSAPGALIPYMEKYALNDLLGEGGL